MIPKDIFGKLPKAISPKATVVGVRHHTKATEAYVDVKFHFGRGKHKVISIPVNYRRTGMDCQTAEECAEIIEETFLFFDERHIKKWRLAASKFWSAVNKKVTEGFFKVLSENLNKWVCQKCELPNNPNWARRTQEIKEMGFTFSTDTSRHCGRCDTNLTHLMLLPVPQGGQTGYEVLSPALIRRIKTVLGSFDVFENAARSPSSLLPDHKFPEIRWDPETRQDNPDDMPENKIREKFQLLTNQRNQQKREVCRKCFQTGDRGSPYGIDYWYKGDKRWPEGIKREGAEAEQGCVGCGWYDFETWRDQLNIKLELQTGPGTA